MDLHKNKGQVTVVIDLSFSAPIDEVKERFFHRDNNYFSNSKQNLKLKQCSKYLFKVTNHSRNRHQYLFPNPSRFSYLSFTSMYENPASSWNIVQINLIS